MTGSERFAPYLRGNSLTHPQYRPGNGEIHLWQIALRDARWNRYAYVLSEAERQRVFHYRGRRARQEFQRSRSALRLVLSRYACQPPETLQLRDGSGGKPELAEHDWHFNLSHSDSIALLAVASGPLGVDVERIDPAATDLGAIANRMCHPSERVALAAQPEGLQRGRVYQLWTHKEAYTKAVGCGLRRSLRTIHFAPAVAGQGARVMAPDEVGTWFVHALAIRPDYAASVCSAVAAPVIHLFNDATLRRLR